MCAPHTHASIANVDLTVKDDGTQNGILNVHIYEIYKSESRTRWLYIPIPIPAIFEIS